MPESPTLAPHDVVQEMVDAIISVRSLQFVYLQNYASRAMQTHVDQPQSTWQLYGLPMTAKDVAALVMQAPEMLDQVEPLIAQSDANVVTKIFQMARKLVSASDEGHNGRGPLARPISISEAAEIVVNTMAAVRTAALSQAASERHEGLYRLWGRHRDHNVRTFLVVRVDRSTKNQHVWHEQTPAATGRSTTNPVVVLSVKTSLFTHIMASDNIPAYGIALCPVPKGEYETSSVQAVLNTLDATGNFMSSSFNEWQATEKQLASDEAEIADKVRLVATALLQQANARLLMYT